MVNRKVVFVTGAGFSAPAKLPVQNKIINEIIAHPKKSILEESIEASGSTKFLIAYIDVGLFLLTEYLGADTSKISNEYILSTKNYPNREDEKYNVLLPIKEAVRKRLESEVNKGKNVCLEDLFTLIDKAITLRENINSHNYPQMDKLKNALMRLFIYYFELSAKKHNYDSNDYINVINSTFPL